jgi:hypothetical protein
VILNDEASYITATLLQEQTKPIDWKENERYIGTSLNGTVHVLAQPVLALLHRKYPTSLGLTRRHCNMECTCLLDECFLEALERLAESHRNSHMG